MMSIVMRMSVWLLLSVLPAVFGDHMESVSSVHGSGTTNPSKCYWRVMEQITERSRAPVRLGYRAVGSGTGQIEFLGNETFPVPSNDFGSGDIPLSSQDYQRLQAVNVGMVHLPVMLGAISFFHSVPGVTNLNLTSCLLAKIFKRDITEWDNSEILAENPELEQMLPYSRYPINVGRRVKGSSSTASITKYMHETCQAQWPLEWVGKEIDWAAGTKECDGSAQMTACIQDTGGTIGYMDAGHGHSATGIFEINLKNHDGRFITSMDSMNENGIAAAGEAAIPPDGVDPNTFAADSDFGPIDVLDRPGPFTWPIVAMTYIYVRKDLSHIHHPAEQALLIAFLKALYRDEYISECEELFGFSRVRGHVLTLAENGIAMLESNLVNASTPFSFELDTEPNVGMGEFVISAKRKTNAEVQRDQLVDETSELMNQIEELRSDLTRMQQDYELMLRELSTIETQTTRLANGEGAADGFSDQEESQLQAALVLGSLSMVLWGVALIALVVRRFMGI